MEDANSGSDVRETKRERDRLENKKEKKSEEVSPLKRSFDVTKCVV
jgi:hypothetical protein